MLELEKAIEMLKAEVFIEMGTPNEYAAQFIRTLVRNGCPFDAILQTFKDLGKTEDNDEDQNNSDG